MRAIQLSHDLTTDRTTKFLKSARPAIIKKLQNGVSLGGLLSLTDKRQKADLAVIILTYNEEKNVRHALESVCEWAREVFVVDSFSSDSTMTIAKSYDAICVQNPFEGYVAQRNYALEHLPITATWILFLDADEWVTTELRDEICIVLATNPAENGFYVKRRLMWMGQWVRRGYYPSWILRIIRHGKGRWEARSVNEHLITEGKIGYLKHDIIHENHRGVNHWIEKHNRYAELEAQELLRQSEHDQLGGRIFGSQVERKRWLRQRIWNHLPPLLRPALYFLYRYVLLAGFLDGHAGLSYHFLQALWFPMLIDIKMIEMRLVSGNGKTKNGIKGHAGEGTGSSESFSSEKTPTALRLRALP